MPRVTPEQLVKALLDHPSKGAKQVAIITRTRPKMLVKSRVTKEPNPFPQGVERLSLRTVTLGASYAAAVNRQRVREQGDDAEVFIPESLWNGQGVHDTAYTVRHRATGRIYLAVKPAQAAAETEAGSAAVVIREKWSDVATGRELDFEADRLADFLPTQAKAEAQDLEQDVQWRTIALDSLVELRYGQVFELIQPTAAAAQKGAHANQANQDSFLPAPGISPAGAAKAELG